MPFAFPIRNPKSAIRNVVNPQSPQSKIQIPDSKISSALRYALCALRFQSAIRNLQSAICNRFVILHSSFFNSQ
jgi:hypothetical protein